MNRVNSLKDFLAALDKLDVPALNVCYADIEGNIVMHPCGRLPLRLPGQGRIPMDGASGANDWQGWIPRNELPLEINPARHFVASANNRPTPVGYPHYLGWMWDCSYRIRRIHQMLGAAKDLTVESMGPIQSDAYDKAAERFVPYFLAAAHKATIEDELSKAALNALAQWNYIAEPEALGPAIWLRWLECYREAVWKDKMKGLQGKSGNWGFSDTNGREPEIEVLEYLTREQPTSSWFDDQGTPEREDRDLLIVKSFHKAVDSLKKQFGADLEKWRWKHINKLHIDSLTGVGLFARDGGPVPGSAFTVNPGSNLSNVGGGASWRMIVDLANPAASVGVYPGGQSENPLSPLYSDQMTFWAHGKYLRLNVVGDPDKLPANAKTKHVVFEPKG
jgi:penicillin amidase